MQQISLYAKINNSQLKICLHALASLTGMDPTTILQHTMVWAPAPKYTPKILPGQGGQLDQYRIHVTNDSKSEEKEKIISYVQSKDSKEEIDNLANRQWHFQIMEMPEAGKQKTTSQSISSWSVKKGDSFQFLQSLAYKFQFEYWQKGFQFVYGNAVIQLTRIHILDETTKAIKLLDPSQQWIVKVYIDVGHLTDIEALNKAVKELEKVKTELHGLMNLEIPDRNAFDTRIR